MSVGVVSERNVPPLVSCSDYRRTSTDTISFKFLNVKISVEFYNLLLTKEVFQQRYKAIIPSYFLLGYISKKVTMLNGKPFNLSHKYIKETFKNYTGTTKYEPFINALEELELLLVDDSYSTDAHYTKEYSVTEQCVSILSSSHTEYLKKLHTDKKLIRQNQKNTSKRMNNKTNYNEYIFNYIQDLLLNVEYDYKQANEIINNAEWSHERKNHALMSLIELKEKTTGNNLRRNATDNRIFNEFVSIKSDLKKVFTYNNLKYFKTVDIRSCYPTYWSTYLLITLIPSYPTPPTTLPLRNVGGFGDILKSESMNSLDFRDIIKEHVKWVKMFTDIKTDPKEVLVKDLGYTKEQAKSALNESINGSNKWVKFHQWLETHFPLLYRLWLSTKIDETGSNIGKMFETVLMQDEELYKYADGMGIKLSYEYDGFGVFADENDKGLTDKIHFIINRIQYQSNIKWGFKPVIKVV